MKKFTLSIILFLSFSSMNLNLMAQDNDPFCIHIIRNKNTSTLLEYLFKKYGVENSELILLKMKNYEINHQVNVLFSSDFNLLMEQLNSIIQTTNDLELIDRLNERKTKFVKFEDIEITLI